MENITMSVNGFTRTLPAMITHALWVGWEGDSDDYTRRVDELSAMNKMFAALKIPARIDFWSDYSIGVSTPHAVRVGTDESGNGGKELEVYNAAKEQWYVKHPEERPAPPEEITGGEIQASAERIRRMLFGEEA